ncbi:Hypothetical protein CINCED_3A022001 [Cinara cedri]|uniref:RING-type domain-containing protein n=1 Tax=Cinara cedri TaxID=506608 RepID=A0A5E4LZI8_9HEMI|nr:Hypothetical protein CINCED_3A022001 [Cinara cedri]
MAPSPNHKAVLHPLRNIVKQEKNIIHMANGSPIILNSSYPLSESATGSPPEQSSEPPTWDLTIYENRLRTFNVGWKLDFITPDQMAKAGLYYLGKQDRVRCLFCSKEFDYWQRGDDPIIEHRNKSPQCPFFRESEGYDVCGPFGFPPTNSPCISEETKQIQQLFDSVGVIQEIKTPNHKDFATLEARLKTFDKCKKQMKQDIQTLCEAGFYYIGDGENDQMICFCCSQGLKDWEDDDEPWTEHAKWSPTCTYVLLSKGKYFVDLARGLIPNQKELSKMIANNEDLSILENNNIKVNLTRRLHIVYQHHTPRKLNSSETIGKQIILPLLSRNNSGQFQSSSKISDSMLCKICYKEEMKIAFIPCGHVIACIQCAMTIDQCAVCRMPFNRAMNVSIYVDPEQEHDDQLPCSSSQCPDESSDQMLCKVCGKEEMDAVFMPCRHIYACAKCSGEMWECPVCKDAICATMQVYL